MLPRLSEAKERLALKRFTDEGMILRSYDYDEAAKMHVIKSVQDVEPILTNNKRLYNLNDGYSKSREWRRAASVPNIIIEKWLRMGINAYKLEDQPKILAMLDSPEYAFLRTAPGRLSKRPIRHFFRASTPTGTRRVRAKAPLRLVTA